MRFWVVFFVVMLMFIVGLLWVYSFYEGRIGFVGLVFFMILKDGN